MEVQCAISLFGGHHSQTNLVMIAWVMPEAEGMAMAAARLAVITLSSLA